MDNSMVAIGAGLAIGLSGLGVATGQSLLATSSMDILGKNPKLYSTLLIYTILGIALVESVVIFGLLVAFQILGKEGLDSMHAIGAGLAIGLTGLGAGFGEGKLVSETIQTVNRNPENKNKALQFMILFLTLIEVVAIYGLIIALQLLK
nr:ATP synthase F0 subunit C [Candidatus Gracilibacteria bacterium]